MVAKVTPNPLTGSRNDIAASRQFVGTGTGAPRRRRRRCRLVRGRPRAPRGSVGSAPSGPAAGPDSDRAASDDHRGRRRPASVSARWPASSSSQSSSSSVRLPGQATAAISSRASGMPTQSSTSVVVKPSALRSTRTASDQHDPDQRDRDQHLPADGHELVVADPGQRAAEPDEHEHEDQHLDEEPEHRPVAAVRPRQQRDRPRRPPAAEEQRGGDRRDVDQVDVLGQEEQPEPHRRVLGVEAADQLALGLGQVERRPVGLADHRRRSRRRTTPAAARRTSRAPAG